MHAKFEAARFHGFGVIKGDRRTHWHLLVKTGLTGWLRGMHTRLWALLPGFESQPSYKLSSWCFMDRAINVCAIPWMDVKLLFLSASICWWMLKISWCPSQRGGELLLAPWANCNFYCSKLHRWHRCTTEIINAIHAATCLLHMNKRIAQIFVV